ncbi:MAG: DegV family protein [Austwickia sp.]|jgi:DegV family protein with EDD domain|nr:MAG: DegV family protein [Austwickia sp.]
MRVAIVTDSTAYLPEQWAAEHDVTVVPLSVLIDMDSYVEGVDRAVGELARALSRAGGATTSRPSPQQFLARYEALADEGAEAIVSVHLSAALSGTYEAAVLAAADAPVPVRVVDSASMGAGLGYAVREAVATVRRVGPDASAAAVADAAAAAASGVARETAVLFCVASLEFLRRGGRIGAASAFLGTALAVKPLLALRDGRIEPVEKQRTMGRAVNRLVDMAAERIAQRPGARVTVHHVGADGRAREIAEAMRSRGDGVLAGEPELVELGLVAAAHLGPGSVGVVVAPPAVA